MSFAEFFILIGVFIAIMLLYRYADRWISVMKPSTVKIINWAGFGVAVLAGIGWYFMNNGIFMVLTFIGVIVYFLFYGYDKMEHRQG